MDGDSDARTESPVWRLLAFSGFLLINLVSTSYVLEYGHRQVEKAVREAPPAKKDLARKGRALLRVPPAIFRSGQDYAKNPQALLDHRCQIGEVLEKLLAR
jgi:hypothetical protein